jgi:NADP-dependent 3-hydroxy acid dehydrogenase YdfG
MADKQVVLITGANTGIGYETVKALYASPHAYTILMGSRTLSKAHSAISKIKDDITTSVSEIVPLQIDIEDDESIGNAFQEVSRNYNKLDTLVNNAGTRPIPTLYRTSLTPHQAHRTMA